MSQSKQKKTTAPLIKTTNLSVHYPLRGTKLFSPPPFLQAVSEVNIEIAPGSFFGLVGESGSGKTSLGRALLKANQA